jgi:hypothetical protein
VPPRQTGLAWRLGFSPYSGDRWSMAAAGTPRVTLMPLRHMGDAIPYARKRAEFRRIPEAPPVNSKCDSTQVLSGARRAASTRTMIRL